MLRLRLYDNASKKEDGYNYCCADVDISECDDHDIDRMYERESTYKEARDKILDRLRVLRDDIDALLKEEESRTTFEAEFCDCDKECAICSMEDCKFRTEEYLL